MISQEMLLHPHPPTLIVRHRKENLKKCSLSGLEMRQDCTFLTYPQSRDISIWPDIKEYLVLDIEGSELSIKDRDYGIIVLDGTWKLTQKMYQNMPHLHLLPKRSLPKTTLTAYPRRQLDCPFPDLGLASLEALYLAYSLLQWDSEGMLDHYYWKDAFLKKNSDFFRRNEVDKVY